MRKRFINDFTEKCSCGNHTHIQIYDFMHDNWIWYCEVCQSTINEPNAI